MQKRLGPAIGAITLHACLCSAKVSPSNFQILDTMREKTFENPPHLVVYEAI